MNKRKAFSLIEVIIATAVFAFFLGSVIAAMLATAHNGPVNERRLQAANLAREGAQLVTQIRDTIWIQGLPINWWNPNQQWSCYNLRGGTTGASSGNCQLYFSSDAWNLRSGQQHLDTVFVRQITITDQPPLLDGTNHNAKLVTVRVFWMEGSEQKDIVIKKLITDWKAI